MEAVDGDVERLMADHLEKRPTWYAHDLIKWEEGRNFIDEPWDESQCTISPEVREALVLNLLTEDNLPYYHHAIASQAPEGSAIGRWTRRWTAEENQHAIVIRDYLTVTRAIDPVALEVGRMAQVQGGLVPEPPDCLRGVAYVTLQELATRIAHRNTGNLMTDEVGKRIMHKVAADEALHYQFYRDVAKAALELVPNEMMVAIEAEIRDFAMPGTGIPGFAEHKKAIADAEIYNTRIHLEVILEPVVIKFWDVENVAGLHGEGAAAQERLLAKIDQMRGA